MSTGNEMESTVLITGAARRIGAAIALAAAASGRRVVLHANRSAGEGLALCGRLRAGGAEAFFVQGDLAAPGGPGRVFAEAAELAGGRIDEVVNNAALFGRRPLREAGERDFLEAWRLNTLAPALLTRHLAVHLAGRGARGAVVNLLDQRIARPSAGAIPYLLSKSALAAFTEAAALELAPAVRVNAVAPGASLAPEGAGRGEPAGRLPLGFRPGPEQIAAAVLYLLDAPAVTGQTLFVDAGQRLA